jgi:RNA polymerase sigma-70 factor (ECF subfamily)
MRTPNIEEELKGLMLAAVTGDTHSYESFLQKVAQLLKPRFIRMSRSVEKADDLIQDVLISIHRKRDLYKVEMPILPWVNAIAKHRFIDSIRSESRRPSTVVWEEDFENLAAEEVEVSQESGEALLEGLSDRQKEILTLAKVEEVPLAEIAQKFDMSLSAVKVSVHRSIKSIREGRHKKDGK